MRIRLLAALPFTIPSACSTSDDVLATGVEGVDCPKDSTLTYEQDIQPFMATYCTTCHDSDLSDSERQGAPLGLNFDTEAGILDNATEVVIQAAAGPGFKNTSMPEGDGPKPSNEQRKMLGEWIACSVQ